MIIVYAVYSSVPAPGLSEALPCFVAPEEVDMRNLLVRAVSSITAMELEDPSDLIIIISDANKSVSSKPALFLRKWRNFATHLSCHYLLQIRICYFLLCWQALEGEPHRPC